MKKILLILILLILTTAVSAAPIINTVMLNQDPDPVNAGDVVEVRFKVTNTGEDSRGDVTIEILPESPFKLYSGKNIKNIGRLEGRQFGVEAAIVDFKLRVSPEARDGDHKIRVRVDTGTAVYDMKNEFFIDVEREKISLKAFIRSSNLITSGSQGTISIELANAGGHDIEFLELELLPSTDYKLLSTSPYVYLGNLDSDDTEIEDFLIYVPKGVTDVSIPIKVNYEVNDEDYESEKLLYLNLLTEDEAKRVGLIKTSKAPYYALIIILIVAGFFYWRKLRKKK